MPQFWTVAAWYCAFSTFVFYQQLSVRNFRGSSERAKTALLFSAAAGQITGIVFVGLYMWRVSWWHPLIFVPISLVFGGIFSWRLERVFPPVFVALAGFVGWPACAYFMFTGI